PLGQAAPGETWRVFYASYTRAPSLARRVLVTFIPPLLPRMLMNPRTVCFCQLVSLTISSNVAPPLRWIIAITSALCVPSRGLPAAAFLPLAGLAFGVGFALFVVLVFPAFLVSVAGFESSGAGFGATALPSRWIVVQMRATALSRFSNFLTGL